MLIEEFYRLGRTLLEHKPNPEELLRLVTDVAEETVKNFYRNVFVVELPREGQAEVCVHYGVFGTGQDDNFETNVACALGIPFSLPAGGNPLQAQGRYGLPVYPCYEPHLRGFQQSAQAVRSFLAARLTRTPGVALGPELVDLIAQCVHEQIKGMSFGVKKVLGVLVLADCGPGGFYTLASTTAPNRIGLAANGQSIVPDYERILDAVLAARVEEGRGAGARSGRCSFSGEVGDLVSAYCKAWTWALPTWTCPLPHGGDEDSLIESIALTPASYRALTVGACVFDKLSRPLTRLVIPEIFSPADTRGGKDQAQRRKLSDLPAVHGSALLVPVSSGARSADDEREYVDGIWAMLRAPTRGATEACRYLEAVTGFDVAVPDNLHPDYRLTLVYFSGETSRGDVHLRATIEDVVPSTLGWLCDVTHELTRGGLSLLGQLMPMMSEKQRAYFAACYASVPYLLARAYGGGYLWQQMEAIVHRQPLGARRIIANAARRMESLTTQWPDSFFPILDEVAFLLHARRFVERVNHDLHRQPPEDTFMPTRDWRELMEAYLHQPIERITFQTMAELGFACGLLVRRFSGWYRSVLKDDKDYLRDRVLTFGASLSPHDVWTRAINGICDTSAKHNELRKKLECGQLGYYETKEERRERLGDYQQRLSAVQSELERRKDDLDRQRDDFMTGFWSGYGLLDYNRKRQPRKAVGTTTP